MSEKIEEPQQQFPVANSDALPPVKFRDKKDRDLSETERKRRSRNRLSNRRSTGFLYPEDLEQLGINPCETNQEPAG